MSDDNYSNFSFKARRQRRKKKRLARLLLVIFVGFIFIYVIFNYFNRKEINSNIAISTSSPTIPVKFNPLEGAVESALEGTKGSYGIVIKNLKTGESYYSNEHKIFKAGSLYKLWIMAYAFNKIQDGSIKEDEVLSQDIETLNSEFNINPQLAEQTTGEIILPIRTALKQMITISHNYSALLLTEKLKLSNIASFLKTSGFDESMVGTNGEDPTTTPSDIALFFEKLYKGELGNEEYTNRMLDLLKEQQKNSKLPKYLPAETSIAHKTGEIGWLSHDAGIVYLPVKEELVDSGKGNYIIVVLSESDLPAGAEDRIAEVSKAAFQYFMEGGD